MKLARCTRLRTAALLISMLGLGWMSGLHAQVVPTVTWTGKAWPADVYTNNAANWLGNTLPLNNGTENFVFSQAFLNTVYFGTDINANKVTITGITSPFQLDDDNGVLNLGSGGFVYAPAAPVTSYIGAYGITLLADQTWDIQSGELGFTYSYSLDGTGRLIKSGAGTLSMKQMPSWTGGLTLNAGRLSLDAYEATTWTLGSANLIIGPTSGNPTPTIVARDSSGYGYAITITNALDVNGVLATENHVDLHFSGATTLFADTAITSKGNLLYLDGAIAESGGARKLTVNGPGTVVLTGANTYTGGTDVQNGALIFAKVNSLPAAPATNALTNATNGYIGFGDDGTTNAGASLTNPQGLFLDRFNKASTFGTVGFDTDLSLTASVFSGPVDLTGFAASAKLGSATHAVLSGTITPQGTATDPYRFGGGGGTLQVDSLLSGTRALVLDSPAARPLTLRLTNIGNTYSGGTTVTNSGLILGSHSSYNSGIPSGSGLVTIGNGGYVGFENWGDQATQAIIDNSLTVINPTSVGAVGFESGGTFSGNVNLGSFSGPLYLATSVPGNIDDAFYGGLVISGAVTITPAGGASAPYRLAGYKGGQLEIASSLTGTNGIYVGDPNSPGTFGDPVLQKMSTVALTGDNSTLSGNITLYGGQLGVGQANGLVGIDPTSALGSGSLVVQGMSLPPEWNNLNGAAPRPKLVVENYAQIIPNNVVLNSDLDVGGYASFKLAGTISGNGALHLGESNYSSLTLTLSGNNSLFTGGIHFAENATLNLDSNNAAGTGLISFESSSANILFNTTAPVIGGLSSGSPTDQATLTANLSDTVLTINQSTNGEFDGEFRSNGVSPADRFRVVKSGTSTLRLNSGGMYFYHGVTGTGLAGDPEVNLEVDQGTLVMGGNFYLEASAPTIWVHGGNLLLDYASIYNPFVIDNGGLLGGTGFLYANTNIGTGATLSPGLVANDQTTIGSLNFSHLALLGGGTFNWDIMKADVSANAWDQVFVFTTSTLDLSGINLNDPASASTRFTLKIISRQLSGAPGLLADFNANQSYSWLLFSTEGILGFDPAKFILDTSLFANSLDAGSGNGWFFLTQSGSDLMLNFSPVPEPSTSALIVTGLGLAGLAYRRQQRRSKPRV